MPIRNRYNVHIVNMTTAEQSVDEKNYRVLEVLSTYPSLSQRHIAEKTQLSLGLVNIIIKRMVKTGTLKMTNLKGRKMGYVLTSKALTEKTERAFTYFSRTIQVFFRYQQRCDVLIDHLLHAGFHEFAILGKNEVSSLVYLSLKKAGPSIHQRTIDSPEERNASEVLLDCRFDGSIASSPGTGVLSKLLRRTNSTETTPAPAVNLAHELVAGETPHD